MIFSLLFRRHCVSCLLQTCLESVAGHCANDDFQRLGVECGAASEGQAADLFWTAWRVFSLRCVQLACPSCVRVAVTCKPTPFYHCVVSLCLSLSRSLSVTLSFCCSVSLSLRLCMRICMCTSLPRSTFQCTSTCHRCTNAFALAQVVPQNRVPFNMVAEIPRQQQLQQQSVDRHGDRIRHGSR